MYTFHRRTDLLVIAESIMTEDPEKAEKSFQCSTCPHLIKEMAQGRNHMIKLSEGPFKI